MSSLRVLEAPLMRMVSVGIQFDRIGEIDTMNEKYYAEVTIEASWEDDKIVDKYNEAVDWNPNLCIENIIQENKRAVKYKTERIPEKRSYKVTQIQIIKAVLWERLEIHNFPLDIQELSVIVTTTHNADEIRLREDKTKQYFNERISKTFNDQQKWRLYTYCEVSDKASYDDSSINSSIADLGDTSDTPKICLKCFVSRQGQYYFWNAYFLIFLISVSSFNVFAVDCKLVQNRLQNTFTLLLTSISFKWVINRSLPTVAYLTSLDMYAIANIFILCLASVWHSLVGVFWQPNFAKELDKWMLLAFAILFFIIHLILCIRHMFSYAEIMKLKRKEKSFIKKLHETTLSLKIITTDIIMENSKL